ncbi:MAG: hypothetical protein P4L91_20635 [Burkholderiaceae bacterium]|nr:hypothetical protein [Burkholderiaceae bacterium]
MNKNIKSSPGAPPAVEAPPAAESVPDERAMQFQLLRRSIGIVSALLRAVEHARELLQHLSEPFQEADSEKDTQKEISKRHGQRRDAVFAAAKEALDPDHPVKKSVDESLATLDGLDPSIGSSARDVKSKVLEALDDLINHALKDANDEKSADSAEKFAAKAQALTAEMDLRTQELTALLKAYKAHLRQAWIERLLTTRNILIVVVLLISVAIVVVGYALKKRHDADVAAELARPKPPAESVKLESAKPPSAALPSKPDAALAQPAPAEAAAKPAAVVAAPAVPTKAVDAKPPAQAASSAPAETKLVRGTATLTSGQDKEATKKSMQALGEIIKEWNAENGMQPVPDKPQKKENK